MMFSDYKNGELQNMAEDIRSGEFIGPDEIFHLNESHTEYNIEPMKAVLNVFAEKEGSNSDAAVLLDEIVGSMKPSEDPNLPDSYTTELKLSTLKKILNLEHEKYLPVKIYAISALQKEFAPHASAVSAATQALQSGLKHKNREPLNHIEMFTPKILARSFNTLSKVVERTQVIKFLSRASVDIVKAVEESLVVFQKNGVSRDEIVLKVVEDRGGTNSIASRGFLDGLAPELKDHGRFVEAYAGLRWASKAFVDGVNTSNAILSDPDNLEYFEDYAKENQVSLPGAVVGISDFLKS